MAYQNKLIRNTIIIILLAVCTALLAFGVFVSNGNVTEWFYMNKKEDPKTVGMPVLAEAIIHEADIDFDSYFDDAFIYTAKGDTVTILYRSENPLSNNHYHYIDIDTGKVDAKDFVEDYFTDDAFRNGYNTFFEWEYEKKSANVYRAYLTLDDRVEDSIEDYEKMLERDLVIKEGSFVKHLSYKIPLSVEDSFFVLDKNTRMVGWFYFKTTFNGEDFVACFEVSGWDTSTTYDDLVSGDDFYVEDITPTRIYVAKRD